MKKPSKEYYGYFQMRDGLKYHFTNFEMLHTKLDAKNKLWTNPPLLLDKEVLFAMKHEATAYLNRMGQFFYFAVSRRIRGKIGDLKKLIPTVIKFIKFRDKQTAHREFDMEPGNLDAELERLDFQFSGISSFNHDSHLVFDMSYKKTFLRFDLLTEHSKILKEVESVIVLVEASNLAI